MPNVIFDQLLKHPMTNLSDQGFPTTGIFQLFRVQLECEVPWLIQDNHISSLSLFLFLNYSVSFIDYFLQFFSYFLDRIMQVLDQKSLCFEVFPARKSASSKFRIKGLFLPTLPLPLISPRQWGEGGKKANNNKTSKQNPSSHPRKKNTHMFTKPQNLY